MSISEVLSEREGWTPGKSVAIRDGYGKGLLALGEQFEDVVALDADLAESTRSQWFQKKFPTRFFQMGISEQDMVVTAAGLAHMGKVPFASTFAIFLQRGWEQIRNCVARQNLNVKFCGSHGGLMTGQDGSSAHALEDIGVMRTLPNMNVVVPADAIEAAGAVFAMYQHVGPAYMRSTRASVPIIYADSHRFEWGQGVVVRDGDDVAVIANGPHVWESLAAANEAEKQGISVRVISMASVKPIDKVLVQKAARDCGFVVTAEDHFRNNGLGTAVAEVLADAGIGAPLKRIGVRNFTTSGTPEELYRHFEVDRQTILDVVAKVPRASP
jgi:transketolase